MTTLTLQHLTDKLHQIKKLGGWQTKEIEVKRHELYGVQQKIDTLRCNQRKLFQVTLFKPTMDGEISFTLDANTPWEKYLNKIVNELNKIRTPSFNLPSPPQKYQNISMWDQKAMETPGQTLKDIFNHLNLLPEKHRGIPITYSELFLDYKKYTYANHQGLSYTDQETSCFVEFYLLGKDKNKETILRSAIERRFANQLPLEEEYLEKSNLAAEFSKATLPQTGEFSVMLGGEALDSLFDYHLFQSSFKEQFLQKTHLKLGYPTINEEEILGERLSLIMNTSSPALMGTHKTDHYGGPSKDTLLFDHGQMVNLWGNIKYAYLQGGPSTGEKGNVKVLPGSFSEKELLARSEKRVYQLFSFSSFGVNPITGDFAAEIRFGYSYDICGNKTPIRGGSVSGNLKTALKEAWFSKEETTRDSYMGSKWILFNRLNISGKE